MQDITNVVTTINNEWAGSLNVCYDLHSEWDLNEHDVPHEYRSIKKIHWVEFILCDKIGFMIPAMLKDKEAVELLETLILDEIEYTHINELKQTA